MTLDQLLLCDEVAHLLTKSGHPDVADKFIQSILPSLFMQHPSGQEDILSKAAASGGKL